MTLLREARKRNKRLFLLLLFIIGGTALTSIARIEVPPFYVWSMYSAPMADNDTVKVYVVENDGAVFNIHQIWNHHKRIMFYYTVDFYAQCVAAGYKAADAVKVSGQLHDRHIDADAYLSKVYAGEEDIRGYPRWLKRYMQEITGKPIGRMRVYQVTICYQPEGKVKELNRQLLCEA